MFKPGVSNLFLNRDLLKLFTTMELMRWTSLVDEYGKELREGSLESPATDVFGYTEEGEKRWKDLKNRVVEHVSTICYITIKNAMDTIKYFMSYL